MKWFGYIHINKSVHVKPLFSLLSVEDAKESPFVEHVFEPFEANTREEALKYIEEKLNVH